jgi:site-specific recombinase XerD
MFYLPHLDKEGDMEIEAFWNGLFDSRWEDASLGPEAIRLVSRLRAQGYRASTRRMYGQMVVHFGRILARKGPVDPGGIDGRVIDTFVDRHLPVCCCYRRQPHKRYAYARRALHHLLAMLREEGVVAPVAADFPPYHDLLEKYARFLQRDRGLAPRTVDTYRGFLGQFLKAQGDAVSPAELVQLSSTDVLAFARQRGASLGSSSWNHLATALSGFYRWLTLRGYNAAELTHAVPLRRRYRLADIPCALKPEEVQRVVAAANRQGPDRRQHYAILLLMATYGLRGCEVRALRLADINWSRDEITVCSPKTGRTRQLPLTQQMGKALLDYLRHERPDSTHHEVFLSRRPPQGPLRHKFYRWVARCFEVAGVDSPHRGAHTLRHSRAVQLLRGGETLKTIGDFLGHRSVETTFIYTKLHVEDLRQVALDPEIVS